MGMTKYVVVQHQKAYRVADHLAKRLGLEVYWLGYTDSSTCTVTLRLKTKRSTRQIQDVIWERFMEADVRLEDPRTA